MEELSLLSVVRVVGTQISACGYCEKEEKSKSGGFVSQRMLCADYKSFCDRGWRRSGTYFYLPDNSKTCCPQYTIRLNVKNFTPSREQKKVLAKYTKWRDGVKNRREKKHLPKSALGTELVGSVDAAIEEFLIEEGMERNFKKKSYISRSIIQNKGKKRGSQAHGDIVSSIPLRSRCEDPYVMSVKLSSFLRDKLPSSSFESFSATKPGFVNIFLVKSSVETLIYDYKVKDVEEKMDESTEKHTMRISIERAEFSEEKFKLFEEYQVNVHNDDDVSRNGFKRFLCNSPLVQQDSGRGYNFGSFHMMYRCDEKLWAVGVVDILPGCLSSVYVFYSPEFRHLSPGKYTALKEIEMCRDHFELPHYYMGYYIHSCHKMRYKVDYKPSELLCSETLQFVDYEICKKLLDSNEHVSFSTGEPLEGRDIDSVDVGVVDNLKVFIEDFDIKYELLRGIIKEEYRETVERSMKMFVLHAGSELVQRLLIEI